MNEKNDGTKGVKITFTYQGMLEYRGRLLKQIATLQAAGFDCRLIYGDWGGRPFKAGDYDFPIEVIPTTKGAFPLALFFRQLRFGYLAGRKIAESDATHVVSFALESALAGALAKRRRSGLKYIIDMNELHIESYISRIKKILWAPIQKFCARKADVIMHAEGNRLEYFKKNHDPGESQQFLLENFPTFVERETVGERAESSPIKVLYVGTMGFDRYTKELVNVFRQLGPKYSLDFVGPIEPDFLEDIERELEKDPAPNIQFKPSIPYRKMGETIRNYHVGIALYKNNCLGNYYCAPNKVYDYLMNGVTVVANDYPGLLTVVEEGNLGACVKEVDLDNFRSALQRIVGERMWENITEEVRNRYSWEAQTPGYLALFR